MNDGDDDKTRTASSNMLDAASPHVTTSLASALRVRNLSPRLSPSAANALAIAAASTTMLSVTRDGASAVALLEDAAVAASALRVDATWFRVG